MDGCVYRTKDGECDLYSEGGKFKAFCDPEHCDNIAPTNADRIRAMTDDELATLIADNIDCNICKEMHDPKYERCPGNINEEKGCCAIWLDWLKQEADEK